MSQDKSAHHSGNADLDIIRKATHQLNAAHELLDGLSFHSRAYQKINEAQFALYQDFLSVEKGAGHE
jgi:hypothetical protein